MMIETTNRICLEKADRQNQPSSAATVCLAVKAALSTPNERSYHQNELGQAQYGRSPN